MASRNWRARGLGRKPGACLHARMRRRLTALVTWRAISGRPYLTRNGTSVVWFLVNKNGRVAPAAPSSTSDYHTSSRMGGTGNGDVVEAGACTRSLQSST